MISSIPDLLLAVALVVSNVLPSETAFQVTCEGDLPFSRTELEAALRPRWRLLGRPLERPILVRAESDGTVTIQVGAGRREVGLQGQTAETAARVVALLAVDLLAGRGEGKGEGTTPQIERTSSDTGPRLAGAPSPYTVTGELLVPFVANGWAPSLEPTVGLERRVFSHGSIGGSVGFSSFEAGSETWALRLRQVPVRAGVGYGGSWFVVRLSGVLRPYFVAGGGEDRGVRWGASVSATAYHQVTTRFALAVSGGLDGFRDRTDFRLDGQPVLTTHWLVPWVGAGIALRGAP